MGRGGLLAVSALVIALGILPAGAAGPTPETPVAGPGTGPATVPELGLETCAVQSPDDFSDPPADVLGWQDGYWHDEPV